MAEIEFKPCPFCGGNEIIIRPVCGAGVNNLRFYAQCRRCFASTAPVWTTKSGAIKAWNIRSEIKALPTADVAPVVHGRCPVCSGKEVLAQDCDNGYCVEIDAEQAEMTIWQGDTCLAVISIDFCPNCGARMDGDSVG